jgi:hypothetical protein
MNPFPTTAVLAQTKSAFLPTNPKLQHNDMEPLLRSRTSYSGDWFSQGSNRFRPTVVTSRLRSLRGFECYGLIASLEKSHRGAIILNGFYGETSNTTPQPVKLQPEPSPPYCVVL